MEVFNQINGTPVCTTRTGPVKGYYLNLLSLREKQKKLLRYSDTRIKQHFSSLCYKYKYDSCLKLHWLVQAGPGLDRIWQAAPR